jgi:hypothetical protein
MKILRYLALLAVALAASACGVAAAVARIAL